MIPFFADFLFQLGFEIFHRVAQCVNPLPQMRHFIGCAGHLQFGGIAVLTIQTISDESSWVFFCLYLGEVVA